jgi:acyl-CoA reductase-like NAD-dependent aldehyde dehydrogenase
MTGQSTLDGFHLPPPIKVSDFTTLKFGGVQIRQPVLTATTLSDVINQLLAAQDQYLVKQTANDLIGIIDAAVERWLKPDDPMRRTAEQALPEITGLSPAMVRLGLTRMLEGYRKESLARILDEELGDRRRLDEFRPRQGEAFRRVRALGPRITTAILAGNIPGLGASELIATLLVKSSCLIKASSDEPLFTALFARTLVEIEPRLAPCLAVLGWPGGKPESQSIEDVAFGRSELLTSTGSDESVSAVRFAAAGRQPATARFIGYGHRLSLGLIGREALDDLQSAARNAAMDVAMFDQQGCLSPHLFYVETGGNHFPRQFAKALAEAMARLEKDLPRGTVDTPTSARLHQIRSVAEIKQADGEEVIVFGSETGTLWTVIYEADPAVVLSPLYRTVRVKPVIDLLHVLPLLEPWRPYLQAAGLMVSESRRLPLAEALGRAGVNRICPVGRMQQPPAGWPQDGRRFIADRVRWVELESP